MVRQENFKLIKNFDGSLELYDLEIDPKEKINLANNLPDIKERLNKELEKFN